MRLPLRLPTLFMVVEAKYTGTRFPLLAHVKNENTQIPLYTPDTISQSRDFLISHIASAFDGFGAVEAQALSSADILGTRPTRRAVTR